MRKSAQVGNILLILVILIIVVGAGLFYLMNNLKQKGLETPDSAATSQARVINLEEGKKLPPAIVKIIGDGFSPQTIEVKAGQSVTWINYDGTAHQLISDAKNPEDSLSETDPIAPSEQMTFPFSAPATIHYYDKDNSNFTGVIIVK